MKNREDPRLLQLLQPVTVTADDAVSSRAGVGYPGSVSRPSHDANARRRPSTGPAQTELEQAVVTEVIEPEQVYVCLWSHADARPGHIHFVVQPATKAAMRRFDAYGPFLQTAMFADGTLPAPTEVRGGL